MKGLYVDQSRGESTRLGTMQAGQGWHGQDSFFSRNCWVCSSFLRRSYLEKKLRNGSELNKTIARVSLSAVRSKYHSHGHSQAKRSFYYLKDGSTREREGLPQTWRGESISAFEVNSMSRIRSTIQACPTPLQSMACTLVCSWRNTGPLGMLWSTSSVFWVDSTSRNTLSSSALPQGLLDLDSHFCAPTVIGSLLGLQSTRSTMGCITLFDGPYVLGKSKLVPSRIGQEETFRADTALSWRR